MANQDVAKAVSQTYKDVKVLYLEYDTWAGNLDYCHGQILRNGQVLHESEGEEESDLIDLFKKFGVDSEFDGFFPPFERGFFPNT